MSRRADTAAGQFFTAFYRWTVLTSSTPARHGITRRTGHRSLDIWTSQQTTNKLRSVQRTRSFATHGRSAEDLSHKSAVPPEAARNSTDNDVSEPGLQPSSGGKSRADTAESSTHTYVPFSKLPVKSHAEHPFSKIRPNYSVVRHRSHAGIILEHAIDERTFAALQLRYGEILEALAHNTDVKVELGEMETRMTKPKSFTFAVIISGRLLEVERVRDRTVSEVKHTRLNLARRRASDRPPILRLYNAEVRKKTNEEAVVEWCLPESLWEIIAAKALNQETISTLPSVSYEVISVEARPCRHGAKESRVPARLLTITGIPDSVEKLSDTIASVVYVPMDIEKIRARPTMTEQPRHLTEAMPADDISAAGVSKSRKTVQAASHEQGRQRSDAKKPKSAEVAEVNHCSRGQSANTIGNSDSLSSKSSKHSKLVVEVTARNIGLLSGSLIQGGLLETATKEAGCFRTSTSDLVLEKVPFVIATLGSELQIAAMQRKIEDIVKMKAAELKIVDYEIKCRRIQNVKQSQSRVEIEQVAIRAAMRSLTHPVVVITSTLPGDGDSGLRHRGVTVSSFNTVSLSPDPIISFNLKTPSSSWEAIQKSGRMNVHILAASSRGAAIARPFTQPHEQPHGAFDVLRALDVKHNAGSHAPLLTDAKEGILYVVRAELLLDKCMHVGDHVIVVAIVKGMSHCPRVGHDGRKSPDDFKGLAYAAGAYRTRGRDVNGAADQPCGETQKQRLRSMDAKADLQLKQQQQKARYTPNSTVMISGPSIPVQIKKVPSSDAKQKWVAEGEDPLAMRPRKRSNVNSGAEVVPLPNFRSEEPQPRRGGDLVYEALRAARDGYVEEEASDMEGTGKINERYANRRLRAAEEEEDDYDFGFERPTYRRDRYADTSASTHAEDADLMEAFSDPDVSKYRPASRQTSHEGTQRLSDHSTSLTNNTSTTKFTPWGLSSSQQRSMSSSSFYRQFSRVKRFFSLSHSTHWKEMKRRNKIDEKVERSARLTTVADFFNLPDDVNPEHPPRVRSLVGMKRQADRARRILRTVDRLDADQRNEFQTTIDNNERIIARKMAFNSAKELRVMLDKGSSRVDFTKARWMEESIERGLAILVDEALRLRRRREEGKVNAEVFAQEKAKLEELQEVLQTEIMRLRDVLEEADGAGDED